MNLTNHAQFAAIHAAIDRAADELRRNVDIEHERNTLKALTAEFGAFLEAMTYRHHGNGSYVAGDFAGLAQTLDAAFQDAIDDRDREADLRYRPTRIYGVARDSARL